MGIAFIPFFIYQDQSPLLCTGGRRSQSSVVWLTLVLESSRPPVGPEMGINSGVEDTCVYLKLLVLCSRSARLNDGFIREASANPTLVVSEFLFAIT